MSTPRSYQTNIKGKAVTFTHLGPVALPDFSAVTSVSVIPFTAEGEIVAVRLSHRGVDLPGGHVEPGETTPEQTLKREVMEEASMTVQAPVLVEVIESDYFDRPSFMLLYAAYVDQLFKFVPPPDEPSEERVVLSPTEFIAQYEAGNKALMAAAIESAWHRLQGR
ncbi:MAG TPA: NUDIX domain-containing protein [Candidatus Saccharimonadales bacterium]|nr:NUDIX domain-containing protein [Candidatus Saccharimonadales bacterium]